MASPSPRPPAGRTVGTNVEGGRALSRSNGVGRGIGGGSTAAGATARRARPSEPEEGPGQGLSSRGRPPSPEPDGSRRRGGSGSSRGDPGRSNRSRSSQGERVPSEGGSLEDVRWRSGSGRGWLDGDIAPSAGSKKRSGQGLVCEPAGSPSGGACHCRSSPLRPPIGASAGGSAPPYPRRRPEGSRPTASGAPLAPPPKPGSGSRGGSSTPARLPADAAPHPRSRTGAPARPSWGAPEGGGWEGNGRPPAPPDARGSERGGTDGASEPAPPRPGSTPAACPPADVVPCPGRPASPPDGGPPLGRAWVTVGSSGLPPRSKVVGGLRSSPVGCRAGRWATAASACGAGRVLGSGRLVMIVSGSDASRAPGIGRDGSADAPKPSE